MHKNIIIVSILIFQALLPHPALASEGRVIQVSPETALGLEKSLANQAGVRVERILLADNSAVMTKEDCEKITDPKKERDCFSRMGRQERDERGDNVSLDIGQAIGQGANSRDAALIVFAVIGIVVLIIWIPYTIRYLYKYFRDGEGSGWMTLSFSHLNLKKTEQTPHPIERNGVLNGLNMLLAMGDEATHMGLALEGGQYTLHDLNTNTRVVTKSEDKYLMGGPSILYGFKEFNGSLDIMGGKGFGNTTGLMSKASLGLNFTFSKIYLGLQLGAFYSKIKDFSGVLRDIDGFQFFIGGKFGITF